MHELSVPTTLGKANVLAAVSVFWSKGGAIAGKSRRQARDKRRAGTEQVTQRWDAERARR